MISSTRRRASISSVRVRPEEQHGVEYSGTQMGVTAGQDVFDHRAMLEQRQILKGAADADGGKAPRRDARKIGAVKQDTAGAWPQHAADDVEQGGLSGAIGADDAADFTPRHGEADVGYGLEATEILADVFHRKQRGHDNHLLRRL